MPVDIRLPNGAILKNVPDDVADKKHMVAMEAIKRGMATNEDFGYETAKDYQGELGAAGETKGGRFLEGVGRGFVNTGRQLGNMFGLISDEEIAEARKLDKDLMATGMGITGDIVGSLAATGGPIGGGLGAAAKGLTAARGASMAARGGRALGKALGKPVGRGTVEGAVYGTVYAGPGDRGKGALWGAGLGLGMGGLVKGLGNAWKNAKVSVMDEAKEAAEELGAFFPISQAGLEDGLPRMIYNAILSNLPGSAGKIRGQYKEGLKYLRQWAGTKAHPNDSVARIDILPEDDIHAIFVKLDDFWKGNKEKGIPGAYAEMGNTVMDASKVKVNKVTRDLVEAESNRLGVAYRIPQGIQSKTQNMLNFRNAVSEIKMKLEPGQMTKTLRANLDDTLKKIDDQFEKQIDPDIFAHYEHLGPSYRNYQTLKSAVDAAKAAGQQFTPPQLLVAAAEKAGAAARSGGGTFQQIAGKAAKSLQDFPSKAGVYQMVAALGLSSGFMGVFLGTGMPALTAAGIYTVARWVGTRKFQEFLMGSYRGKAALNHPQMQGLFRALGMPVRLDVVKEIVEE
jgi:hypothetical protein